jgi:hypothetical protein
VYSTHTQNSTQIAAVNFVSQSIMSPEARRGVRKTVTVSVAALAVACQFGDLLEHSSRLSDAVNAHGGQLQAGSLQATVNAVNLIMPESVSGGSQQNSEASVAEEGREVEHAVENEVENGVNNSDGDRNSGNSDSDRLGSSILADNANSDDDNSDDHDNSDDDNSEYTWPEDDENGVDGEDGENGEDKELETKVAKRLNLFYERQNQRVADERKKEEQEREERVRAEQEREGKEAEENGEEKESALTSEVDSKNLDSDVVYENYSEDVHSAVEVSRTPFKLDSETWQEVVSFRQLVEEARLALWRKGDKKGMQKKCAEKELEQIDSCQQIDQLDPSTQNANANPIETYTDVDFHRELDRVLTRLKYKKNGSRLLLRQAGHHHGRLIPAGLRHLSDAEKSRQFPFFPDIGYTGNHPINPEIIKEVLEKDLLSAQALNYFVTVGNEAHKKKVF